MSCPSSKRQQARNERILQDLIKTVPGNNVCADCQVRNPGWASWSLGIFLCMRCAALHRKMGTHITKVKSLSMDTWSYEQVETMKRIGNIASNNIYNPLNTKAPIHFDADETDSSMERFIRQKYQEKLIKASIESSAASPDSDDPPPLPPKTGARFGFRSSSSTFPFSVKHMKEVAQKNDKNSRPNSKKNKTSRVFSTPTEGPNDHESKGNKLCDMGFAEKDNPFVLKDMQGDPEKFTETLVRVGESDTRNLMQKERSKAPISDNTNVSVCLSIDGSSHSSDNLGNPFDLLDSSKMTAQPQSSQSTGRLHQFQINNTLDQQALGYNFNSLAPFQSCDLDQMFQNVSINKSQSLFPNRTGPRLPEAQVTHTQQNQQSLTPEPYLPQQHVSSSTTKYISQLSPRNANYNPFNQDLRQAQLTNSNNNYNYNSHLNHHPSSLDRLQYPVQLSAPNNQKPGQYLPEIHSNSAQQPPESLHLISNNINPYFYVDISHPQDIHQQSVPSELDTQRSRYQPQITIQQDYPSMPMPKKKVDTRSILDLFNRPDLAPSRPISEHTKQETLSSRACSPENIGVQSPPANFSTSSRNPFASDLSSSYSQPKLDFAPIQDISPHISQESNNLDTGGWMNGRHSPDAWRYISARSMR